MLGQALAQAADHGARSLVRVSWAWGLLMFAGLIAAIVLAAALRHARRLTHARPGRERQATPNVDAWRESARRLRPDDPSAPRERGQA